MDTTTTTPTSDELRSRRVRLQREIEYIDAQLQLAETTTFHSCDHVYERDFSDKDHNGVWLCRKCGRDRRGNF